MRITGGLCPWPQYQCRAGQCCNQRDNVRSDMVWTIEVDVQSEQPKLDVFIFRNPVAIQFSFFAIHTDCSRISGLPNVIGKLKKYCLGLLQNPSKFICDCNGIFELQWHAVLQDFGIECWLAILRIDFTLLWKLLIHNPINPQSTNPDCGGISKNRVIPSQLSWLREECDCSGIDAILAQSTNPLAIRRKLGDFGAIRNQT